MRVCLTLVHLYQRCPIYFFPHLFVSGQGVFRWTNGCIYEGEVSNGLRCGHGTLRHEPTGVSYVGNWLKGKKHGQVRQMRGIPVLSDSFVCPHSCLVIVSVMMDDFVPHIFPYVFHSLFRVAWTMTRMDGLSMRAIGTTISSTDGEYVNTNREMSMKVTGDESH